MENSMNHASFINECIHFGVGHPLLFCVLIHIPDPTNLIYGKLWKVKNRLFFCIHNPPNLVQKRFKPSRFTKMGKEKFDWSFNKSLLTTFGASLSHLFTKFHGRHNSLTSHIIYRKVGVAMGS